jgi:hypothetical protein
VAGAYTLSSGTLSVGGVYVGSGGSGNLIQTGGSARASNHFSVGDQPGGTGTYSLSGNGTLSAGYGDVGYEGIGIFTQSGGTNTIASDLYLGGTFSGGGGTGTYTLSGTGSLSVSANGAEYVGYAGSGSFVQTGGANSISGTSGALLGLQVGSVPGAFGLYSLSNGTLSVIPDEIVGEYGNGTFTQTGGTNTSSSNLVVGHQTGGVGTYNLSGGTTQVGGIALGDFANSTGSFVLSGTGSLTTTATEGVGSNNNSNATTRGTFTQTGGTNLAAGLVMGNSRNAFGSYTLSGGTMTISGTMTLTGTNSYFNATGGIATVGSVNNAGAVYIGPSGNLTVNGNYTQAAGSTEVAGLLSVAGQTTVNGGTFEVDGGSTFTGTIVNNAALSIQSGSGPDIVLGQVTGSGSLTIGSASVPSAIAAVQLTPGSGTSTFSALTINTGSTLDISNNALAITYGIAPDPAAAIRKYLKSAYSGGLWIGTGLTSSSVAAEVDNAINKGGGGIYGIGYVDGGVDINQAAKALVHAVGNQIVYTPALIGDANLDGSVSFIDLGIVAQNLGAINSDWEHGDFNYDGSVNFTDLGLLAQNLNKTTINTPLGELVPDASSAFVAEWNLTVAELQSNRTQPADLPEPGMIGLLGIGAAGVMARRRRRA